MLDLVERPAPGEDRVIGIEGLYRNDPGTRLTRARSEGVVVANDDVIGFAMIREQLADASLWAAGS